MRRRIRTWPGRALAFTLLAVAGPVLASPSIPGAGDWRFVDRYAGLSERICSARKDGPDADLILLVNLDSLPVLTVASPAWTNLSGVADVGLSIDGAPALDLEASLAFNLVMVVISDEALVARLRTAESIDWTLPFGEYRTDATGLGIALDAVARCEMDKAKDS